MLLVYRVNKKKNEYRYKCSLLGDSLFLLAQQTRVQLGCDAAMCNDRIATEEGIGFLIIADSHHDVTRRDGLFLVGLGHLIRNLQNLGGQVFRNGSEVNGGIKSSPFGVAAFFDLTLDTGNGEDQSRTSRLGHFLSGAHDVGAKCEWGGTSKNQK